MFGKTRVVVYDDSKSAKVVWDELRWILIASSQQEISNLQNCLMKISFDENMCWDKQVSNCMDIIDELAVLDRSVSEEEKVAKLIRSLPPFLND